jgi:hypothetical protein
MFQTRTVNLTSRGTPGEQWPATNETGMCRLLCYDPVCANQKAQEAGDMNVKGWASQMVAGPPLSLRHC